MKKIKALALLPLLALASCGGQNKETNETTNLNVDTNEPAKVEVIENNLNSEAITENQENTGSQEIMSTGETMTGETMTGEDLNEAVMTGVTSGVIQTQDFNEPYKLPNDMEVFIKGKVEINEGKISNVTFDGKLDGFQLAFANGSKSLIGKKLKGLKADTVSGASLTTEAFNNFLAKINK